MAGLKSTIQSLLAHPLTRGLDVDAPQTTALRRTIIQRKGLLRRIYEEWYGLLSRDLPAGDGGVLELGSGGGFFDAFVDRLLTSDVFVSPGVRVVLDARHIPVADRALRGIVMTNVFHHIPDVERFLEDAARAVTPGGVVAMIEPWNNAWARYVCEKLHHEAFEPDAPQWQFETHGPLSGSNHALAWIVFERDRAIFEKRFPQWRIETVTPLMPISYVLSGGVSTRLSLPAFLARPIRLLERPMERSMAIFAHVVLRRTEV